MNIINIINSHKPIKCDLWSPLVGICYLDRILPNNRINVKFYDCDGHCKEISFSEEGKYFECGKCVLFPSRYMKDWNKYAWKKGDLVTDGESSPIKFEKFINFTYTYFEDTNGEQHKTNDFYKLNNQEFQPYDKVLVRDNNDEDWNANLFSHYTKDNNEYPFACINDYYKQCIPFDEKYLGTAKNPNNETD